MKLGLMLGYDLVWTAGAYGSDAVWRKEAGTLIIGAMQAEVLPIIADIFL